VSISSTFYEQLADPKSANDIKVVSLFTLLGSAGAKAARKMLMKLTPGLKNEINYNFISIASQGSFDHPF